MKPLHKLSLEDLEALRASFRRQVLRLERILKRSERDLKSAEMRLRLRDAADQALTELMNENQVLLQHLEATEAAPALREGVRAQGAKYLRDHKRLPLHTKRIPDMPQLMDLDQAHAVKEARLVILQKRLQEIDELMGD